MVRPRYNRLERGFWRFTKGRIWLAAMIQVYILVIIFVPSFNFYYVCMVQGAMSLFILALTLQEYIWSSMTRLCLMRKLHRYEYHQHACRLIGLQVAIIISLSYAVLGFYSVTLAAGCVWSESKYLPDEMTQHASNDICFSIFNINGSPTPPLTYLGFIVAELLPFVFYFWLNNPHDCFHCVGKDPDRRFSVFQLTRRELLIREHQAQYGTGAFGVAGNLYDSQGGTRSSSKGGYPVRMSGFERPRSTDLVLARVGSSKRH